MHGYEGLVLQKATSMHQVRSVALAEITWQEDEKDEHFMSSRYVPDYADYEKMAKLFPLAGLVDLRAVANQLAWFGSCSLDSVKGVYLSWHVY